MLTGENKQQHDGMIKRRDKCLLASERLVLKCFSSPANSPVTTVCKQLLTNQAAIFIRLQLRLISKVRSVRRRCFNVLREFKCIFISMFSVFSSAVRCDLCCHSDFTGYLPLGVVGFFCLHLHLSVNEDLMFEV